MIKKYLKKPIPVTAIQVIHDDELEDKFWEEVNEFFGNENPFFVVNSDGTFMLETLEGDMTGRWGDYVLRGPMNDFWIVRKNIFEETYKEVK